MTKARATDLLRLDQWKNGGCLNVDNPRPSITEMAPGEREEILALWKTLPGYCSFNDALRRVAVCPYCQNTGKIDLHTRCTHC